MDLTTVNIIAITTFIAVAVSFPIGFFIYTAKSGKQLTGLLAGKTGVVTEVIGKNRQLGKVAIESIEYRAARYFPKGEQNIPPLGGAVAIIEAGKTVEVVKFIGRQALVKDVSY